VNETGCLTTPKIILETAEDTKRRDRSSPLSRKPESRTANIRAAETAAGLHRSAASADREQRGNRIGAITVTKLMAITEFGESSARAVVSFEQRGMIANVIVRACGPHA